MPSKRLLTLPFTDASVRLIFAFAIPIQRFEDHFDVVRAAHGQLVRGRRSVRRDRGGEQKRGANVE